MPSRIVEETSTNDFDLGTFIRRSPIGSFAVGNVSRPYLSGGNSSRAKLLAKSQLWAKHGVQL
jgi:hypothetical protein